jgi:hypothetical protein
VAGRFPLFLDACVRQQIIDGLTQRHWYVQRVIDFFPEGTDDDILFEYAATNNRVFVTTDEDVPGIGEVWLRKERSFTGVIYWPPKHHRRMSDGDIIREIEKLAETDDPFAYPIVYIKPDK